MRILGLDVGEKRIGIAISDELCFTANGLDVIERKNNG
ncbi:MAG: RuvX/YqgF family protein, partial [Thermoanaerobacteraceae bacterium]|nr:RuvX/YqgF family protein [Thermoanaerobacteraceae bacterium]